MNRLLPLLTVLALAAVAAAWFTDRMASGPAHDDGAFSPTAELERPVEPFRLGYGDGAPFTDDDLRQRWDLVFFGYTYCPDVCPTTLQQLRRMAHQLEEDEARRMPAVTFVSVDPERDEPERLDEYVRFFHDDFRAATGPQQQLESMVSNFGAVYRLNLDEGEHYTVDHSAAILAVDPDGVIRAALTPPHTPERMLERLDELGALN